MHHLALLRRVTRASGLAALCAVVVVVAACGGAEVDRDGGHSILPDGGASLEPPPTPTLEPVSSPIPYPVATLRGRAPDAKRIIVEGAGNPLPSSVLPDGSFCIDVPTPEPGSYVFQIRSQSERGVLSTMAAVAMVVQDPAAPPIPGALTCDGSDPAGCSGTSEICDNGRDDDCNGLRDARDPACITCMDDALEPNDDSAAPRVEPGRYESLQICPGDEDWYGVYARTGDRITVRVFFTHASGDIDLQLLGVDGTTVIDTSAGTMDDEIIVHTATTTGEHEIRVYGFREASNSYVLDVQVVSGA